jgi:hypothetical protein
MERGDSKITLSKGGAFFAAVAASDYPFVVKRSPTSDCPKKRACDSGACQRGNLKSECNRP